MQSNAFRDQSFNTFDNIVILQKEKHCIRTNVYFYIIEY